MSVSPAIYSPVDGCDYALLGGNLVEVTERATGLAARFTLTGKWISGEHRICDLNMLLILRPRNAVPFVGLKQDAG